MPIKNQKEINQAVKELIKLDHRGLFDIVHRLNTALEGSGTPNPIKPRHQLQLGMVFGIIHRLETLVGKHDNL